MLEPPTKTANEHNIELAQMIRDLTNPNPVKNEVNTEINPNYLSEYDDILNYQSKPHTN